MSTPIPDIDFGSIIPKSYIFVPSEVDTFHRLATTNGTSRIVLPKGVYRVQVTWNGTQRLSAYAKPTASGTGEYEAMNSNGAESVSEPVSALVNAVSDDGTGYVRVSASATSAELSNSNVRALVTIVPMGIAEH